VILVKPIELVIARLEEHGCNPRRSGAGWSARCPSHDDTKPSLSVKEGDDECAVMHCFVGCPNEQIVAALKLNMADLFPPKPSRDGWGPVVATYRYRGEDGCVLFEKRRFANKNFSQRQPDGTGNIEGVRRVPYRLPELLDGVRAGRWIFVVEGEKAADRLVREGFVATCGNGGAGKWHYTERDGFRGAKVAVLADNDKVGRDHALDVARSLNGIAQEIRLVELPGLPEKGDVVDYLDADGTAEGLRALVTEAPEAASSSRATTSDSASTKVGPSDLDSEDGAALLDDVARFVRRYVVCSSAGIDAAALFALHSHAFDAADVSPRFVFQSVEPQSGKTRGLEVLKLLVRAPLFAVNVSEAALFRVVEARTPTILHDEIDAVFGPKARDREDLRAMLNAGYERGATVERCVGEGSKLTVKSFPVFAPVAMAGLGRLPETVEQRSIIVRMKRRAPDEPVAKLRRRQVGPEAEALRSRLEAWAAANVEALAVIEPDMPCELDDRAEDIWEPLVAIADRAGGDWPARARDAARALFGARRTDEATIGVRLLADIRAVFGDAEALASGDLAGKLAAIEGAPWAEWTDKGFTAHALARLLRRYEIRPDQHWMGTTNIRGYVRAGFADVFARYLPKLEDADPPGESVRSVATVRPQALQGNGPNSPNAPNTSPGRETADSLDEQNATFDPLNLSLDDLDMLHAIDLRVEDERWLAEQIAALDPNDPDHGRHVADLRAEDVRRREPPRRPNEPS
jgi:Protein of unknown function (DUF3631)